MKLFKNVIQDGLEYNNMIKKYNSKNQLVDITPIEIDKVITITLEEYKELLIYKGKYLGLTGHLGKMEINGTAKEPVKDSSGDVVDYYFTFTDLDASMFYEGCVITGKFTTYVGIMPMSATGYLKLTGIE